MAQSNERKELAPHKVVGVVKFATDKETFKKVAMDYIHRIIEHGAKVPFAYDKILVIGTVNGKDIFEIRFIKFI